MWLLQLVAVDSFGLGLRIRALVCSHLDFFLDLICLFVVVEVIRNTLFIDNLERILIDEFIVFLVDLRRATPTANSSIQIQLRIVLLHLPLQC